MRAPHSSRRRSWMERWDSVLASSGRLSKEFRVTIAGDKIA